MSPEPGPAAPVLLEREPWIPRFTRELRLLLRVVEYELRKASFFRMGFLVKEILRGTNRALVMILVYYSIFQASGGQPIGGYSFTDLSRYLVLAAIAQKMQFDRRGLDLSEQIFEGRVTKFLVMPFRFFVLPLGRFVQFLATQLAASAVLFGVGWSVFRGWWPLPESGAALLRFLVLALLGSYCSFLMYLIIHFLAFWLDVVWTLLVMVSFITMFLSGSAIPIRLMPDPLPAIFGCTFPCWSVYGAIEAYCGRLEPGQFARGIVVLAAWIGGLSVLQRFLWRRGVRRYSGSGM